MTLENRKHYTSCPVKQKPRRKMEEITLDKFDYELIDDVADPLPLDFK